MALSVHTFFFDHPFLWLLLLPLFLPLFLFCLPLLLLFLLPTTFFFLLPLFLLFKLGSSLLNKSSISGKHMLDDDDRSIANLRPILGHDDHDLDAGDEGLMNPAMLIKPMVSEPSLSMMPLPRGDAEGYKEVSGISSKDQEGRLETQLDVDVSNNGLSENMQENLQMVPGPTFTDKIVISEPSDGKSETQLDVDVSNDGLSENLQENLKMVSEPTFMHKPSTIMEGAYVVSKPSEEKLGTQLDVNVCNNGLSKNRQGNQQMVPELAFMQQSLPTVAGAYVVSQPSPVDEGAKDVAHPCQKDDGDFSEEIKNGSHLGVNNKVVIDELNDACQKDDGDLSEERKSDDHLDLNNKATDEQSTVDGMRMEEEKDGYGYGYVPSPPIQGEGFVSVGESSHVDEVKREEGEKEKDVSISSAPIQGLGLVYAGDQEEEEEKDVSIPSPPIQGEGFVYAGDQSPHYDNMKEESMDDGRVSCEGNGTLLLLSNEVFNEELIKKGTLGEEPSAQDQQAMYNYCGRNNNHVKGDGHESRPVSTIDGHGEILLANGHGESAPDHEASMDGNEKKTEITDEHESADVREASIKSNDDEINIVEDGNGDPHHEEAFISSDTPDHEASMDGDEKTEISNEHKLMNEHESADDREALITSDDDMINILENGDGDPHHEEAFTSSDARDHEASMDGNEKTGISNEHESADDREALITSNDGTINIVENGDGDPHHEEAFTSSDVKELPINIKVLKSEPHEEEFTSEEGKKELVNAEPASCEEAFMSDDEVKKHPSHLENGKFSGSSAIDVQEAVGCPTSEDLSSDISGTRQMIIDTKQKPKDTKAVNNEGVNGGQEGLEPLIEGLPILEENHIASMEDLQVSDSNPADDTAEQQQHLEEPYKDGNAKLGWKLNVGVPDTEHVEEPQKALDGKPEGWGLNLEGLSAENYPRLNPTPKQGIEDPHREVENSQNCVDMESCLNQQGEDIILDDIKAIRKIVGCDGDPNAHVFDQIRELYAFLGMEPLSWIAEVNDLDRARGELDVLKAVVGVK